MILIRILVGSRIISSIIANQILIGISGCALSSQLIIPIDRIRISLSISGPSPPHRISQINQKQKSNQKRQPTQNHRIIN